MFSEFPCEIQLKIQNYVYELEISKKKSTLNKYITNYYMDGGILNYLIIHTMYLPNIVINLQ